MGYFGAMPATMRSRVPATLVTVRLTDAEGTEHTLHGETIRVEPIATASWENHSGLQWSHYPADRPVPEGAGPIEDWLLIHSATGNPFNLPSRLVKLTGDWHIGFSYLRVRIASNHVDVRVITKAGTTWIAKNLSLDTRRNLLVEQIKALDPALAETAENLLYAVEEDAFGRGD